MTALTETRERCVKSDLWPAECAHCRGLTLDIGDLSELGISRRWQATTTGTCPTCGHLYDPGDRLFRTTEGERMCERCIL